MLAERVQEVGDEVARHMDAILQLFKPGAKITVLVRRPCLPEADFMLGNDDLDQAIALLERCKVREATNV